MLQGAFIACKAPHPVVPISRCFFVEAECLRGSGTTEAILKQKRDLFDVLLEAAGMEGKGGGKGRSILSAETIPLMRFR